MYINNKAHVYLVLQHSYTFYKGGVQYTHDAVLHGVYSTREIAQRVALKVQISSIVDGHAGYVAVLKKSIAGPSIKPSLVVKRAKGGHLLLTKS